jgi:hypothetical protein
LTATVDITLALLDTNAYLRLAKRIRPLLGVAFGQKNYVLTVLKDVEDEVRRSGRLQTLNPWFDTDGLALERDCQTVRLSKEEKAQLDAASSLLHGLVIKNVAAFTTHGRSPPSLVDCRILAFGQIRPAIVVTDDLGMHTLAALVEIKGVWHCHELVKKMLTAQLIDKAMVRSIYEALEANRDLTATWISAKHSTFSKVFGKAPA